MDATLFSDILSINGVLSRWLASYWRERIDRSNDDFKDINRLADLRVRWA
jgi:hypothetical protein